MTLCQIFGYRRPSPLGPLLSIKSSESTGLSIWPPPHHPPPQHSYHHGACPKELAFHQQSPLRSNRSLQLPFSKPCCNQRRIQKLHCCCMNSEHLEPLNNVSILELYIIVCVTVLSLPEHKEFLTQPCDNQVSG